MVHIRREVKLETFVLLLEIPFSDELLDYLCAVSEFSSSGALSTASNCKQEYVMGLNIPGV